MALGTEPKKHLVFGLVLLALFAFFPRRADAQSGSPVHRYKVIELPLRPFRVSNSGELVGNTDKNQAATWTLQGGLRLLPGLQGFPESEARGSNQSGDVVGFFRNSAQSRAFVYRRGKLLMLVGDHSRALAVNDSDQIAGESAVPGKALVSPVLWKKESMADLGGCCGGAARGMNNHGQIIGDVYDQDGRYRAVLWDGSQGMRYLGSDNHYSSAIAINDSGHVLVQELGKGLYIYFGPDKMVRVEIPNQQPADGRALNDADQVVGAYGPSFDADRAFVWSEKDGFHDLNDLIPGGSRWKLQIATGINNRGQIVGVGDHNGKEYVGFSLMEEKTAPSRKSSR